MTSSSIRRLADFVGGEHCTSQATRHFDILDPSTGRQFAQAPCCTEAEIDAAVQAAHQAFPAWAATPAPQRVQILYRFRELIVEHIDELTRMVCTEHGKVWEEARGDVLKAKEVVEVACGIPSLMMGRSLMDTSTGYDTVLYREPLGVFAGVVPFNFPAMIPMGWIMPLCIATGNTLVIKASNVTPMTALRMAELLHEAGLPAGVVNVITCENEQAGLLLKHPAVRGVTFVGTTRVGRHIYATAAANGKRVQTLCQAKNHALVLEDAPLERTALGIINASYGCAGERCMALPVVVVQESVADALVETIVRLARALKIGPAYERNSQLGPLVTDAHRQSVIRWIEKGIQEGAQLVLDGRGVTVAGYENGFYLGPSVFDHVTPAMSIGRDEIFGPVLCVKRVKDFEQGIELMNASEFANGSVIFTQNGHYAREFARRTHAGMVGVNVGIPVPISVFPFSGHKNSFFGDLHVMGEDGVKFYTESKSVTTRWFDEEELKRERIDTWDGTMGRH